MAWGLQGRITLDGQLLLDADLCLSAGITVVMGPSGSGKSTLLRLLAGLPTAARLDGQVERPSRIGWLAQDSALQPRLTVGANVGLMRRLAGQAADPVAEAAMLAAVGLDGFQHRHVDTLSGGQRARVALARVMMQDAPLVMMDEPFSALDPANRQKMQDLALASLGGRCVLLVTHDRAEAFRLADRLLVLRDQRLSERVLPDHRPPRELEDEWSWPITAASVSGAVT